MEGNVAIAEGLTRFFNFMANLGLFIRDDPPKVIDMTGREWGAAVNGLELSIRGIPQEDARQQAVLSVVIRNAGPEKKTFTVPGWLFFYEAQVEGPNGSAAPLSGYGSQLLQPERKTERLELTLAPGEAKETDLMLGLLYDMRSAGDYRVRVAGRLTDSSAVTSNEIVVRV